MRIAQIAPLYEAVPPKLYGGTEGVVSFLTEELVELGHDVTLFASGDSVTAAKLEAVSPQALRLAPTIRDPFAPHLHLPHGCQTLHEGMTAVRGQAAASPAAATNASCGPLSTSGGSSARSAFICAIRQSKW